MERAPAGSSTDNPARSGFRERARTHSIFVCWLVRLFCARACDSLGDTQLAQPGQQRNTENNNLMQRQRVVCRAWEKDLRAEGAGQDPNPGQLCQWRVQLRGGHNALYRVGAGCFGELHAMES